ncbi:CsbD family protein [Acetobacteraceae bacterium B3987]|nr:CsbD family protein [Acetobacteraceae bacterium B3987]
MVDTTAMKAEGFVQEAKGRVKDAVGALSGDAAMQAGGKIDQLGGRAKHEFADLYDANESRLEAVTAFIQERPFVALGIVSLVGLVIGRLIFRKRS